MLWTSRCGLCLVEKRRRRWKDAGRTGVAHLIITQTMIPVEVPWFLSVVQNESLLRRDPSPRWIRIHAHVRLISYKKTLRNNPLKRIKIKKEKYDSC